MKQLIDRPSVYLDHETHELVILDQTKLPGEILYLNLSDPEEIWEAIHVLRVRGAPAIGVAAAYGIYAAAYRLQVESTEEFAAEFLKLRDYLDSSRPTAVNLGACLNDMASVVNANMDKSVAELLALLLEKADEIDQDNTEMCRRIGVYGAPLIPDKGGVLTHCNAGYLATVSYGTALAPVYYAHENGNNLRVYADETRPLLQGARLTALELQSAGVDTTLICDNMAATVMKNGWVDVVFVGADRVAANGDAANKIGTNGVAILAKHYGIPFYICSPLSTFDMNCPDGDHIPVEQRKPEELISMWYEKDMAPRDVKVFNPAFDVTDHELITGFVTEYGIAYPPFDKSFAELYKRKEQEEESK